MKNKQQALFQLSHLLLNASNFIMFYFKWKTEEPKRKHKLTTSVKKTQMKADDLWHNLIYWYHNYVQSHGQETHTHNMTKLMHEYWTQQTWKISL